MKKIAILGYGTVGKGVYDLLLKSDNKVIKVFDKLAKEDAIFTANFDNLKNIDIDLVVECLPNIKEALDYLSYFLNKGISVITSNKAILANNYNYLLELALKHNCYIGLEATVAGGIPIIHTIYDLLESDNINYFMGITNGTSNYILDKIFKDNKSFKDALTNAQKLGYAEVDPSSDIDGIDSKYKACILANTIYQADVNLDSIACFGIRNINDLIINYCKEHDYVIRLISYGDESNLFVLPFLFKKDFIFSNINLNNNCILLNSDNMQDQYLIGQGAGRYPTANAILLDINRPIGNININNKLAIKNTKSFNYIVCDNNNLTIIENKTIKEIKELYEFKDIFIGGIYA